MNSNLGIYPRRLRPITFGIVPINGRVMEPEEY